MSGKLKNIVLNLIKNNDNKLMTIDEFVNHIKSIQEYQRMSNDAIKINLKKILNEINKELKINNNTNNNNNNNNNNYLSKKHHNPLNISSLNPNTSIDVSKFIYIPTITLSSLGGMDDIINEIKEIISNPLYHYDAYKQLNILPIKGILLCGPPGCGKTTLAYAIGGEYKIPFYKITGPDIISSLSGESENIIRNLFNTVVNNSPSILFIDEIETILGKRENLIKEMEKRIVAQIMTCIDDINNKFNEMNNPVFVIGATSKPEFIDASLRRSGRFDKEIHIGFPSLEMRKNMLMSITKNNKIDKNLNYYELAKKTPGYLAADLESLVRTAGHHAINRYIKNNLDINEFNINKEDFDYGISVIQPTSKREGFTTIPNVSWENIGGLKELREELYYDIVLPIINPKKLKIVGIQKSFGVLLYGPPGCGKTLLAKAVANEAKANFISIKGPELLNKYVGESERAIRSLFIRAKNSSPCIIFFDELDALVPKRSGSEFSNGSSERVVNQLLTEMDGLEDRKEIFIIGATNRPDIIDPAMLRPGRLDKLLYVPLPGKEDRLDILKTILKKIPYDMNNIDLNEICNDSKLDGFSGADLAALIREAQLHGLKRLNEIKVDNEDDNNNNLNNFMLEKQDFNYAIDNISPSVSSKDRLKYENLKKKLQESRSHIN